MYSLTPRSYRLVQYLVFLFHGIVVLLAVCVFIVASVERNRYATYYRVITNPSRGVEATTLLMILSGALSLICPIMFVIVFVVYPQLMKHRLRRCSEEAATIIESRLEEEERTMLSSTVPPPLNVEEPAAPPEASGSLAGSSGGNPLDHTSGPTQLGAEESEHRRLEAQQSRREQIAKEMQNNHAVPLDPVVSRVLYTLYYLLSALSLWVFFFLGLYGAMSTALAHLQDTLTLGEGWALMFTEGKVDDTVNAQLCSLQIAGKCSGGDSLCSATSYPSVESAYAQHCPYCGADQETIATFTRTCSVRYNLGPIYPETYFGLIGSTAFVILLCLIFSAFSCTRHMVPSLSYAESVRIEEDAVQTQFARNPPPRASKELTMALVVEHRENKLGADTGGTSSPRATQLRAAEPPVEQAL